MEVFTLLLNPADCPLLPAVTPPPRLCGTEPSAYSAGGSLATKNYASQSVPKGIFLQVLKCHCVAKCSVCLPTNYIVQEIIGQDIVLFFPLMPFEDYRNPEFIKHHIFLLHAFHCKPKDQL